MFWSCKRLPDTVMACPWASQSMQLEYCIITSLLVADWGAEIHGQVNAIRTDFSRFCYTILFWANGGSLLVSECTVKWEIEHLKSEYSRTHVHPRTSSCPTSKLIKLSPLLHVFRCHMRPPLLLSPEKSQGYPTYTSLLLPVGLFISRKYWYFARFCEILLQW
jgi:hypothetical protein